MGVGAMGRRLDAWQTPLILKFLHPEACSERFWRKGVRRTPDHASARSALHIISAWSCEKRMIPPDRRTRERRWPAIANALAEWGRRATGRRGSGAEMRSCPRGWCKSGGGFALSGGFGRFRQAAAADNLTKGSSLNGAMVSSVMSRARWTAHSSFCSSRMAPTKRVMASSLGKMPTTSVRRLISPFSRSSGLVEWILGLWSPAFARAGFWGSS